MGRLISLLVTLCAFGTLLQAQGLGEFVGTVTDPSGAVISGAKVTVTEVGTGFARSINTNLDGFFTLPSLRPAAYSVGVEAQGFRSYTQSGVTLRADQSATINIRLELGSTAESIQIVANGVQVDTSTSTIKQVVDERRMVDLPLNGRNAAQLTLLVAGATNAPNGTADQGQTKTFPGAVTISTNGSRANMVSYHLDGGNNTDEFTNVNAPFPFPDALQEFSVQASNYSAEYGQNAGGVVNIITKSGTNELHGNAFGFLRNAVFNSRNFFAANRDQLKRGQMGGTLGGPVVIPKIYNGRDRTFFFAGYQRTTIRNVQEAKSAFVPTDANLSGDFSALATASNPGNPLQKAVAVLDPLSGQPFAGNRIPISRFDPASQKVATYLPRAGGNGSVFYALPVVQDFGEVVVKLDHMFSQRDRLTGRYFGDKFKNAATYSRTNILTYADGSEIFAQNGLLQETHIFSPTLLNDLHFNYARENSIRGPAAGVPDYRDFGVNIYQPGDKAIESLAVTGFFTFGDNPIARFTRNNFTASDDVRWVRGKHSMAFGVHAEISRIDVDNRFQRNGSFGFTSDITNYAMASFLLGNVNSFRQGAGEFRNNRDEFYGLYAQDNFRATSRLTLNFGLRWEPGMPWREIRDRFSVFHPDAFAKGQKSTVYVNAPPGLFFVGDAGVPRWGLRNAMNLFAPRLGFAYDLTGSARTSLRGGVGLFYDSRQSGLFNNRFVDVSPFSPQLTYTPPPGPFSDPTLGAQSPFPAQFPPAKNIDFPAPVLAVTYDPSGTYKVPATYNWNLAIEHQLASNWLIRAAYVGSHSSHLPVALELNPAVYIPGSKLGTDQRRLFQGYQFISQASQQGNSYYNSLQLGLEKRLASGFTILANYTFAKSYDDLPFAATAGSIQSGNSYVYPWYFQRSTGLDRGPSDFDVRQRFVASFVWESPKLGHANPLVRGIFGNWQLGGVTQVQSGTPLTMLAGKDQSQTGIARDRAVQAGNPYGPGACGNAAPCVNYINPASFVLPALGEFGNTGKGSVRFPGQFTSDLAFSKTFPLRERVRLQFRAEFFNAFNRVNFAIPNQSNQVDTVSSAGFGSIRAANDPRIGQMAIKILF